MRLIACLITISFLWAACNTPEQPVPFPDFSQCGCERKAEPVCGIDGRTYLNTCYASCVGVQIADSGNCSVDNYDASDTLSWSISTYCHPIAIPQGWNLIQELSDGTEVVYDSTLDTTMRVFDTRLCRCLPPNTMISTPEGDKPLERLREGEQVWTVNSVGEKIAMPILQLSKVDVDTEHQILQIRLSDGRLLMVSPLHPDTSGRALAELKEGDCLSDAEIRHIELLPYKGSFTMDFTPCW